MALKFSVSSLDDIPEQFHAAYKQVDGGYQLDAEGVVPKSKVDEFRTNNIALTNKITELERKFEGYKDLDPDKARAALAEIEQLRDKKLLDEGKVEELLNARTERMRADLEGKLEAIGKKESAASKRAAELESRLQNTLIDGEISKAVANAGAVRQGAMRHILSMARDTWHVDEQGTLVPKGANGTVIYGPKGESPLTPAEWAGSVMKEHPYLFESSSGGGAGGGDGRGGAGPQVISRQQVQSGSGYSLEDIASGKVQVQ